MLSPDSSAYSEITLGWVVLATNAGALVYTVAAGKTTSREQQAGRLAMIVLYSGLILLSVSIVTPSLPHSVHMLLIAISFCCTATCYLLRRAARPLSEHQTDTAT